MLNSRTLRLESLETRETPALVAGLDPSFASGGKFTLDFGADDRAQAVAVQPDGKIVIAGTSDSGAGSSDIAVARYNPDGTIDTTFANGTGSAKVSFGANTMNGAEGLAIQADGRIVVVGYTNVNGNDDFAIVRFTAAGVLDASFDTDGKRTVDFGFGTAERASSVAIQSDGKIVAAGYFSGGVAGSNFAFVRINPLDGSLDNTFNGNGTQNLNFGTNDFCTSIAIQSNGMIVGAGYTDLNGTAGNENDFAVVRLLSTGAPDPSFDTDGQQTIDFGLNDRASGVAIQTDGRIVVAGTVASSLALARLSGDNGTLDATFDGDGKVFTVSGKSSAQIANAVAIQWDGRIVVAGTTNPVPTNFFLRRFNTDGSIDGEFNGTGTSIDFGDQDRGAAVALDPNGRAVLVGATGAPGDFAVARVVATTEEGRKLAVGGSANGRAGVLAPNPVIGLYGAPTSTPAGVFPGFSGAVRVAVGDVNGDGISDTAMMTGPGAPTRFAVVNGKDNTLLVPPTAPFTGSEGFDGGGFIAVADFDNDGRAEVIVTPDQGGGPRVTIFSLPAGGTLGVRANFLGIDDSNFRGGARAAAGDVNCDGVQDLAVSAGFLGGPRVGLFNGKSLFTGPARLVGDFFAFPGTDSTTLRNGSFVAIGDINGDGFADLVFGGGPGGAPRVYILSGQLVTAGNIQNAYNTPVANFFVAGNGADRGGVRVATTDADGDLRAELAAGSGEGSAAGVRIYLGVNFTSTGEPGTVQSVPVFGGAALAGGVYVG